MTGILDPIDGETQGVASSETYDEAENQAEVATAAATAAAASVTAAAASATAAAASATASASLLVPKTYKLINSSGTSVWRLFAPGGTEIGVGASTTSGLQEMINLAYANGGNIEIIGGGTSSTLDYGLLVCTSTVAFKPMRNMSVIAEGVHLLSRPSTASAEGVTIDSCMMVDFKWNGEITYAGTSSALVFRPTVGPGVDPLVNIVDSRFFINSVVPIATASNSILMDTSSGSMTNSDFHFCEVNQNDDSGTAYNVQYGLHIKGTANHFARNYIRINHSHSGQVPIAIGDDDTYAGNVYSNTLDVVGETAVDGATGISVVGRYNVIRGVSRPTGSSSVHLTFSANATGNDVTLAQASATVVDSNGGNHWRVAGVQIQ